MLSFNTSHLSLHVVYRIRIIFILTCPLNIVIYEFVFSSLCV